MTARRSPRIRRSTTINHTFTQPGVYYVTVTAIDDRGLPVSQTFVQLVHLPLTASRPNSSSAIAWETRAGGNRVWVVNADNDTASVFNAATTRRSAKSTSALRRALSRWRRMAGSG